MLDRASMEVVCADCGCVQGLHSFTAAPGEHSHPMGGASARAARIAAIAMAYELPSHVVREAIRIARLLEGYKRGAALAVKLAAMLHGIRVDLRRLRPYRALRKLYQEGTLDRPVAKRLDTAERYLEEFTAKLTSRSSRLNSGLGG
ncbi:hypothetical protein B6U99_03825 [Candidatus Geothermarchaeota archaeon ex4572_27]|nr:MAG: hypothetical protein B6U99_03825 [Candidatus Geothermarchaeota archaeon ex4572_27]